MASLEAQTRVLDFHVILVKLSRALPRKRSERAVIRRRLVNCQPGVM
ncbi:MAG: hypothetical protein QOH57_3762 [Mycobacterium sp.]|nr:hypothetical protein [Mycobacterium sp.]